MAHRVLRTYARVSGTLAPKGIGSLSWFAPYMTGLPSGVAGVTGFSERIAVPDEWKRCGYFCWYWK